MKNTFLTLFAAFLFLLSCQQISNSTKESTQTTISATAKPVFDDGYPTKVSDVMLDSLYDFYFWLHHRDVTDRAITRFTNQLKNIGSDKMAAMQTHRRLAVAYMMAYEKDKCAQETDAMSQLAATLPLDNLEKAKVAATQAYYHYWFDISNKNGYNNIVIADSLMRLAAGKNDIRSVQMHFLKAFYMYESGNSDKALQNIDSAFINYARLPVAYPSVKAWAHIIRTSVLTSNKDDDINQAETFFENKKWENHPAYAYFLYSKVRLEGMTNHVEINQKVDRIYDNSLHRGHLWQLSFKDFKFRYLVAYGYTDQAKEMVDYLLKEPKFNKATACALAAHLYADLDQPNEVDKYAQKTVNYLKTFNMTFAKIGAIYGHLSYAYGLLNSHKKLLNYSEKSVFWSEKTAYYFEKFYGTQNMHYNGCVNFLCCQYAYMKNFKKAEYYTQKTLFSIGYNEKDKDFKGVLSLYRFVINTSSVAMVRALKYEHYKSDEAYRQAEDAMNLYYRSEEKLNNITQGKNIAGGRFEYLYQLHYLAIERNLALKNPEKAFYYAEKLKQFTFRNNINFDPKALNAPTEIFDEEKQLRGDITNLQKKVNDFGDKQVWSDQILTKQNQLHQLMVRLKMDYPKYYNMRFNYEPAPLADIQHQVLDDQTALIEYYVGDTTIYVFTVLKNDLKAVEISKGKDFEQHIEALRYEMTQTRPIQDATAFAKRSTQLYDAILRGVLEKLPTTISKLIIAPDGVLSYIPFEVLMPSNNQNSAPIATSLDFRQSDFLLKHYQISYAYSANLLMEQKRVKRHDAAHLFAGFAPKYQNNDTLFASVNIDRAILTRDRAYELKGAKEEVNIISELIGGQAFANESATESAFKKQANQYRILHFAMHSLTDDKEPMFSKLLFTLTPQDTTNDNDLTAGELYAMQLNADLAVLSACNTGFGKISRGEGVMSLARAFTYAGVPATVTSLWKVPDLTTREIMVDFYKNLKQGMTKDAALRQAKLTYLQNTPESIAANPYFWAGFVPMGNMEAIDMTKDTPLSIWGTWIGLALVMGIVFWFCKIQYKK